MPEMLTHTARFTGYFYDRDNTTVEVQTYWTDNMFEARAKREELERKYPGMFVKMFDRNARSSLGEYRVIAHIKVSP